jgi:hypothetical protein
VRASSKLWGVVFEEGRRVEEPSLASKCGDPVTGNQIELTITTESPQSEILSRRHPQSKISVKNIVERIAGLAFDLDDVMQMRTGTAP